ARWWTVDIYLENFRDPGIAMGYSVTDYGTLNAFVFSLNDGSTSGSRFNFDNLVGNSLAKAVKLTRSDPSARELDGGIAHRAWINRIAVAMGRGASRSEREQIANSDYEPIFD